MAEVITVSALNHYVKMLLDANDRLFDIALRGEIANFVQNARSGHCYFSLRDEASSVKAVMFRADARRLAFRPEEGMRVVVRCRATLYERDGAFQLYVNDMFPDCRGQPIVLHCSTSILRRKEITDMPTLIGLDLRISNVFISFNLLKTYTMT